MTWNRSPEADTYEVFRADSFAGQKTKVKTTAAWFMKIVLCLRGGFFYWVKALNATFGESDLFYSDLGFIRCRHHSTSTSTSSG
ncbi:MAG: hypothetical protein R2875_06800 [Desulfobacterales bacterium]